MTFTLVPPKYVDAPEREAYVKLLRSIGIDPDALDNPTEHKVFDESQHPRDEHGRFTAGEGGGDGGDTSADVTGDGAGGGHRVQGKLPGMSRVPKASPPPKTEWGDGQHAQDILAQRYPKTEFVLHDLTPTYVEPISETLDMCFREWPVIQDRVEFVVTDENMEPGVGGETAARPYFDVGSVALNAAQFCIDNPHEAEIAWENVTRFSSRQYNGKVFHYAEARTPDGIVLHEMAHILDGYLHEHMEKLGGSTDPHDHARDDAVARALAYREDHEDDFINFSGYSRLYADNRHGSIFELLNPDPRSYDTEGFAEAVVTMYKRPAGKQPQWLKDFKPLLEAAAKGQTP